MGFTRVDRKDGEVGEIVTVGISPAFRGIGLGRILVHEALAVLKFQGAKEASLTVLDRNRVAISLYEKMGFTIRKALPIYSRPL